MSSSSSLLVSTSKANSPHRLARSASPSSPSPSSSTQMSKPNSNSSQSQKQMQTHHRPAFVHSSTSYNGSISRPASSTQTQHTRNQQNASSASPSRGGKSGGVTGSSSHSGDTGKPYHDHREYYRSEYLPSNETDDDYPPSKESYPPSFDHDHDHTTQMIDDPSRGIYGYRRTPSGLGEVINGRSPQSGTEMEGAHRWNRCAREGGALGRWMMIGWVITTGGFLIGIGLWRGEVFEALDNLSKTLSSLGFQGHLIFGFLILITTIPPLPLYSTLIVLSGYTFGAWEGFVVSYLASLGGAVGVFLVARGWLKDVITKCLSSSPTSMSLLHIIPANPHLLLLIRIAPYPYNLLNVILASSPSLTLRTYTTCTAVSLCKLILHTWIGAGIHDLSKTYGGHTHGREGEFVDGQWRHNHTKPYEDGGIEGSREDVKTLMTWLGIALCIILFFYLTYLAKRAVRKAQEEQERNGLGEETMRFLGDQDGEEQV
ncbi:hypothetical protein CI109_105607 [Kwoniella shandongensis]|uniref:Golgi apparatus membrane protein TVP38 n=1 Tax=Kwoniella shandongensis TaxID=1734106 RepID=A0A5M6C3R4_9TREE|nr:uncharacterized protein CI109_002324 [Kwoniella shandongensis]KAA5529431.1 hypothetical protein CI109_002324 [Kwoniella shandongensis]